MVDADKQIANFLAKLKVDENCEGREILVLPNPAIPWTPFARPCNKKVGPQVKRKLGTETTRPGFEPSVEGSCTTSEASSPPVAVLVMGLSGVRPQVSLLHPGLGGELQVPHDLESASEHCAELH